MKMLFFLSSFVSLTHFSFGQFDGNTTPTYPELIQYYQALDKAHAEIELYSMGESDYGLPIYLCVINGAQDSLKTMEKARSNTTILINNGIHPGEPDGVNACLLWIDQWIKAGKKTKDLPVIAIIPLYNVGGAMNRSANSRANQNGPEEYGFRGNAQNLDLNRDFIKMDSKNMFTFARIYHALEPDVFLDTHVSNGADYQYVMTYIASVKERLAPSIACLTYEKMIPYLEMKSSARGYELIPYVNTKKEIPDSGIVAFNDLPRYAMGYAALMNSISFTLETHMLKPFPDRVQSTLVFIDESILWMKGASKEIEKSRKDALEWEKGLEMFKFNYEVTEKADSILFKGYEAFYTKSEVTGEERLKYLQDKPYEKMIPFYMEYTAKDSVVIPNYYIIGGQCSEVINMLEWNGVEMIDVKEDKVQQGGQFQIITFEGNNRPYEGHYLHTNIKVDRSEVMISLKKGDVIVPTNQPNKRFIISVLEPNTPDSYFAWNYFDSFIQQKEYFSPYVFEEKALEILKNNPELQQKFDYLKLNDPDFAESTWDQLYFIYRNSPFFEPSFNILPIHSISNL